MKEFFTKNWTLKILSFALAILLWILARGWIIQ